MRELDERLQSGLDTLEASVDIEPGGLEWEPADRRMTLGVDHGPTAVRWAVRDGQGALVDQSANARLGTFPVRLATGGLALEPDRRHGLRQLSPAGGWPRGDCGSMSCSRQGRGHPDDEPGYEVQYPGWTWSSVWSRPPWRRR